MTDEIFNVNSTASRDEVAQEQPAERRQDQRLASELSTIFNALDRLITMMRVYPKGHPILDEIAQGITARMGESIHSHGELIVNLGARELTTRMGTPFFTAESAEKKQFIYYNAYADGLVRVIFHEGVTSKELQDFLRVINRASQGTVGSDDDTVTLLWELELEHITYSAVDGFVDSGSIESFGELNEADATAAVVAAAIEPRGATASKLAQMFNSLDMVHVDIFTQMQVQAHKKMAVPTLSDRDLSYAFGVDDETIDRLTGEWSSGVDLEYRLIEALLSIVRVSAQSQEGQKAAALVTQVTLNLLDKEMYRQAARILELLHDRKELFTCVDYDPMGELIDELSDPLRLEALLYMMQTTPSKHDDLVQLLLMLGPAKVQWQILLLLADEKRKVVAVPQMVEVLLKTAQPDNESQFVAPELTKSPTYFRRLLPVLADRGVDGFRPLPRLLRAALQLADRETTLVAMQVDHPVWGDEVLAEKYLQPLSSHDDEEVRKLALKRLGEHHADRFRAVIRDSVLARRFKGRTHAELRFLMRVFVGSTPSAVATLRKLLQTRGWMNAADREFAKMAAAVLLESGDQETIAFLENRINSFWTHPDLRNSWRQTLQLFAPKTSLQSSDGAVGEAGMPEVSSLDPLRGVEGKADDSFVRPDENRTFYVDGRPDQVPEVRDVPLEGIGEVGASWGDVPGLEAVQVGVIKSPSDSKARADSVSQAGIIKRRKS